SLVCLLPIALAVAVAEEPLAPKKVDADGLENVYRIAPGLYSGSGPEGDKAFTALQKLGIKTLISVDGARPDLEHAKKYGMAYVHVPVSYNGVPREKALQIAKAVREMPGPRYTHRPPGKHRGATGAGSAMLCADDKCRVADALAVLRIAGTDPRYAGLFKSVEDFKRPTVEELSRLPAKLPEVVSATG